MSVAFVFPGQGSQTVGMLAKLPAHEAVTSTLREASDALSCDMSTIDSESALASTVNVQLALYIAGVASARALVAENVIPAAVAGMSIGAFAAAVICQTLKFKDGLAAVKERATLMESQFADGYGMTAIIGLSESQVDLLVRDCSRTDAPVFISNINTPRQITVSGCISGLEKIEKKAPQLGANRVERLKVAVPSHCPLFEPVALKLKPTIKSFLLRDPQVPYISNVRARSLRKADAIADDLATNVAHGVRWHDSIAVLVELGCDLFVEPAPGNTLCKLSKDIFDDVLFVSLEETSLEYVRQLESKEK